MEDFRGRWALVTGAASGIGRAIAARLAGCGMGIVAVDCDASGAAELTATLAASGCPTQAVAADVADASAMEALALQLYKSGRGPAILVNNAGVDCGGPLLSKSLNDWRWVTGTNLWGVIHGIHYFAAHMHESGRRCAVVNVASMAGLLAPPYSGIYNATKHAIVALSETLAHELTVTDSKVSVHVVCPGFVKTNIFKSHRWRPGHLLNPQSQAAQSDAPVDFEKAIASGIEPARVADLLVEALVDRKFWVFTHPEYLPAVMRRTEAIVGQKLPDDPLRRLKDATRG